MPDGNKIAESNLESLSKAGFEIEKHGHLTVMVRPISKVIVDASKTVSQRRSAVNMLKARREKARKLIQKRNR